MALAGRSCGFPARILSRVCVCGILIICSAGCATGRYRAAELPAAFQAPPVENAQTVDLSRLASAATSSEFIARGDVLEVTISAGLTKEDNFTTLVRVNDDGYANLHDIGDIPLAGLELQEAEAAIASAGIQRGLYRAPHVTVTMKRQRTNRVTVVGAVKEPGQYDLPRGSSNLLTALVAAGGLSEDAGTNVEIRHPGTRIEIQEPERIAAAKVTAAGHSIGPALGGGGPKIHTTTPRSIQVNLVSAAREGSNGYRIEDGGVVMVEKRDPKAVHVAGLVRQPGKYDFPIGNEFRVLDALALAGWTSTPVANKVFVIRRLPQFPEPQVIQLSIREAKSNGDANLLLAPGDIISVEQTPATILLETIKMLNFGTGVSFGTLGLF